MSNAAAGLVNGDPMSMGHLKLSDEEFKAIAKLIYDHFGICLTDEKRGLVLGRTQSMMSRRHLSTFAEYLDQLKADRSGQMLSELVNLISTNHTSFFRESNHFDYLTQKALPQVLAGLQKRRSRDLRIWCAACSSGEEAYTIQMSIMHSLGMDYSNFDAGLLATDISTKVLEIASQGIYSIERIHDIPRDMARTYFKNISDDSVQIADRVRKEILFRRFNLMNRSFPFKPFQIIFCRNVMIYFDAETRLSLLSRLYQCLEPGGYLFLGHSEAISPGTTPFLPCVPAVYQKRFEP